MNKNSTTAERLHYWKGSASLLCLLTLLLAGLLMRAPAVLAQVPFVEKEPVQEKVLPPESRDENLTPIYQFEKAPESSPGESSRKAPILAPGRKLSLSESIAIALENNPRIKISREEICQAVARFEQARSSLQLKSDITGAASYQGPSDSFYVPPPVDKTYKFIREYNFFGRISLEYLLTSFGKVENQVAASFTKIGTSGENLKTEEDSLTYDVKCAFFNILKADAMIDTARDYLASAGDHLDNAQVLYRQGIVSRFDVVKAHLSVSQAQQALLKAENSRGIARSYFLTLLNCKKKVPFTLLDLPAVEVDDGVLLEDLQRQALDKRHEIAALKHDMESSALILKARKAEKNPDVMMSANYDRQTGSIIIRDYAWSAGVSIKIPLLDGGNAKALEKEAQSVVRSLDQSMDGLQSQVKLEVEKAWLDLQLARQVVFTCKRDVATAYEGYRMAKARYKHGMSTSLEMEDALRSLNDSRVSLVSAVNDLNVAFTALEKAVGTDIPHRRLYRR